MSSGQNGCVLHNPERYRGRFTEVVTVSPKFQVVIPLSVRNSLGIRAGQKVQVILYEDRIELIPLTPIRKMRGFLKGIDTTIEREADRV